MNYASEYETYECGRRAVLTGSLGAGLAALSGCTVIDSGDGAGGEETPADSPYYGSDSPFEGWRFDDPPELDGWPTRQYSNTNVGWKPNTKGPTEDVEVAWTATGGPDAGAVTTSPAVVDGSVFFGRSDGSIAAVDADGGTEQWVTDIGEEIRWQSPTVVDGTVFIGSSDNRFYALDADTGEALWFYGTRSDVTSTPVVEDGRVFFGTDAGALYAADALTGEILWETEPGDGPIQSGLAVSDGTVYLTQTFFGAYDAATGEKLWDTDDSTNQPLNGTPTMAGDLIFGEFGMYLGVIGTDRNNLGGAFRFDATGWGSPAVAHDKIFVGHTGGETHPTLRALTIRKTEATVEGFVEWEVTTARGILSSPVVVDGTVYAAATDPKLLAVDAETGDEQWSLDAPVTDHSTPAVVDGTLYVGGADGLYAIEEGS